MLRGSYPSQDGQIPILQSGERQNVFYPVEAQLVYRKPLQVKILQSKQPPKEGQQSNGNMKEEIKGENDASKGFGEIEQLTEDQVKNGDAKHGLLSLFNTQQQNGIFIKPKILVCVTMYNEAQSELKQTLDGIVGNIAAFQKEANLSNNEIAVVVIYDGIDRMNNSNTDDNMLNYFDSWDEIIGLQDRRTMRQEYDEYCKNLKLSKMDVEKIKKNDFKELDERQKLQYNTFMKEPFQAGGITPQQQMQESLNQEKSEASQYIKQKINNAYIYQMKHIREQALIGEDNDEKQVFNSSEAINLFHCVKYQNGGKLSSHLWFFSGFCELMQPEYTILIDAGLVPDKIAIFNMFLALETDKNIGGVCGFMGIKLQDVYTEAGERNDGYSEEDTGWFSDLYQKVFNIQKAQMYEYNMGHFIDKPFESLFGYIQVLPGAFSGYRWEALKKDSQNESILDDYLSSVLFKDQDLTLEQENMNLAEDRILCLKIYSKRDKRYTLRYLPNCKARVDPVTNFIILVGQRRRWINGSTFALKMCLENKGIIYESQHTPFEIVKFKICMFFGWMNDSLSYISVSIYFTIVFIMLMELVSSITISDAITSTSPIQILLSSLFLSSYFIAVAMTIYFSLIFNNQVKQMKRTFYALSSYFGVLMVIAYAGMMIYVFLITVYVVNFYMLGNTDGILGTNEILKSWEENYQKQIFCYLVVIGFFINFIPYILNPTRIWEMFTSFIHFVGYQSQYIHQLLIYAFCRIDDLSWGTKGADAAANSQKEVSKRLKFQFVMKWLLINVFIGFGLGLLLTSQILENDGDYQEAKPIILIVIASFFVGQLAIRIFGSVLFEIQFNIFRYKMNKKKHEIYSERQASQDKQKIDQIANSFFYSNL